VTGKYGPHIITQTDMIRYITYHPECAPFDVSKTTLEAAGLVGKKVVTMPESATALDGFKLLSEANMLAVPVVDKEGKVVGTLATSGGRLRDFIRVFVEADLTRSRSPRNDRRYSLHSLFSRPRLYQVPAFRALSCLERKA
jgi:CBS-domain-containing membrane protein